MTQSKMEFEPGTMSSTIHNVGVYDGRLDPALLGF